MKRGRHDSEYDKIRRAAGYVKPRHEFPDDEEERAAAARVEELNQDFKDRMAELRNAETAQEAERLRKHAERRASVDRAIMLDEYKRLDLTPPEPLCSLGLLLQMGWKIEPGADGRNVLTRPPAAPKRKTREEWEKERREGGS